MDRDRRERDEEDNVRDARRSRENDDHNNRSVSRSRSGSKYDNLIFLIIYYLLMIMKLLQGLIFTKSGSVPELEWRHNGLVVAAQEIW